MDEHDIHHAFTKGDMTYSGAMLRLRKLGYDAKEADQIVSEWVDAIEADRIASDGAEEEYR
jgi:hypothetical protein